MRLRLLILSTLSLALLTGCGDIGSYPSTTTTGPVIAPTIVTQPASLTVPMGLEGIFSVTVAGNSSPLTYQWFRNGTAITAANSVSYTTPAVAATDTGAVFTVTISNSAGSVTSQPATLTAGARAPKNGDLRFQQVDSENTVNGYFNSAGPYYNIPGLGGLLDQNAFGNMVLVSGECYYEGCALITNAFAQPAGTVPLASGFFADYYTNFVKDLNTGYFDSTGLGNGSITTPNTVVTSMELDPTNNVFAMSYTQTSETGGFDLAQHTINPASLAATATQEGLASRVITAISYNAGQITYFSYGWTGDTTTTYDTTIATSTFAAAASAATTLAAQGYIITAIGGDAADGVVMVGTRVHGDAMPRPIMIASSYTAQAFQIPYEGYAVVGIIDNPPSYGTQTGIWIGQR